MRYFISVDVPETFVQDQLHPVIEELETYEGMNTINPENAHLTVLFIGDHDDETALEHDFTVACEEAPSDSFPCHVHGVGVFPHMKYIKVVWCAVEEKQLFNELHEYFSEEMNVGVREDYVPHITLGRLKFIGDDEKQRLQEDLERFDRAYGSFDVSGVRLKRSVRDAAGARHETVARCDL